MHHGETLSRPGGKRNRCSTVLSCTLCGTPSGGRNIRENQRSYHRHTGPCKAGKRVPSSGYDDGHTLEQWVIPDEPSNYKEKPVSGPTRFILHSFEYVIQRLKTEATSPIQARVAGTFSGFVVRNILEKWIRFFLLKGGNGNAFVLRNRRRFSPFLPPFFRRSGEAQRCKKPVARSGFAGGKDCKEPEKIETVHLHFREQ